MINPAQLIHNWRVASAKLKAAKAVELRWRMLIAIELFPSVHRGTNTNGKLKLIAKENYVLTKDNDALTIALEKLTTEFPDVSVDSLVSWGATLSASAFEALPQAAQQILADVLTIKPATPSLKYAGEGDDE